MTSFSVDLAKFGQNTVDNADAFVRKIGFDLHKMIVERMFGHHLLTQPGGLIWGPLNYD